MLHTLGTGDRPASTYSEAESGSTALPFPLSFSFFPSPGRLWVPHLPSHHFSAPGETKAQPEASAGPIAPPLTTDQATFVCGVTQRALHPAQLPNLALLLTVQPPKLP